jgi:polyisoprenoid-binding protein YceI
MALSRGRRWALWLTGGVVLVAALAVGGTFFYIHVVSGPAPASLSLKPVSPAATASAAGTSSPSSSASAAPGAGALAGTWKVGTGSVVGYRVKEVLLGQDNIAVGRTSSVSGTLTISGTRATAGSFTVQMATITSDQSQRDTQFRGRIMDTARFPTGTLRLTSPIELAPLPASGVVKTYRAAGELTLHGTTRPVSFALKAERAAAGLEISGSIPIQFSDYGIANPSFGSFVTTASNGQLEFLIKFARS